jgi:uncharacterized membrane protein
MTDYATVIKKEPEKSDTYHNQDTLMRISTSASRMAGLFLVLLLIVVIVIGIVVWWYISGRATLVESIIYFVAGLVPLFLGGFFWIALRAISEGIYLLMDIEDNTRHVHNPPAQDL